MLDAWIDLINLMEKRRINSAATHFRWKYCLSIRFLHFNRISFGCQFLLLILFHHFSFHVKNHFSRKLKWLYTFHDITNIEHAQFMLLICLKVKTNLWMLYEFNNQCIQCSISGSENVNEERETRNKNKNENNVKKMDRIRNRPQS